MLADLRLGQKVPDGFLHLRIAELSIAHNAKGQVIFFISPHSFYIGRIHGAIKHPHRPTGNGNLANARLKQAKDFFQAPNMVLFGRLDTAR